MWIELLCGLVLYKVLRMFFGNDDVLDVETSDFNAIFAVATRLEKLYGGKAYVGLRIPDADSGSRQNIDLVLVTKREAVVICVKNMAGFVSVNSDGSWLCISEHKHKEEHHPDPVADAKRQALVLEEYLEQRGVSLPEGYLSSKVIISNPKFRTLDPDHFPPEVIQYDQWVHLKPESKGVFSGWIKGAFRAGKKDMQDSTHQQLQSVLSTAPMWDRLELKGSKFVLGEFMEFKGKHDDLQELQYIKRSKVGQMVVQKTSMFGLAPTKLQVLYCFRDYRTEGSSSSEWKEVTVRSSTEVVFQPQNSKKVRKFKLSAITSLTLSA
ncbi:Homoserine kinase [Bienertia sinuspersici]